MKEKKWWLPDTLGFCNIVLTLLFCGSLYLTWLEVPVNRESLMKFVPAEQLPGGMIYIMLCISAIGIVANFFRRFIWCHLAVLPTYLILIYYCMKAAGILQQQFKALDGISGYGGSSGFFKVESIAIAWVVLAVVVMLACIIRTIIDIFKNKENGMTHVVLGAIGTVLTLTIFIAYGTYAKYVIPDDQSMLPDVKDSESVFPFLVTWFMQPAAYIMAVAHAIAALLTAIVSHVKSRHQQLDDEVHYLRKRRNWQIAGGALTEITVIILLTLLACHSKQAETEQANKDNDTELVAQDYNDGETLDTCDDTQFYEYYDSDDDMDNDELTGFEFKVVNFDDRECIVAGWEGSTGVIVDCAGEASELKILLQADFNKDGEKEAVVYAPHQKDAVPFVIVYDKDSRQFIRVEGFEPQSEPQLSIALAYDHTYIVQRVGERLNYYELIGNELKLDRRRSD